MSKKKETTALVPVKNTLPAPVKKGQLKTPFSLVDEAIHLNTRKWISWHLFQTIS